mmetsp:Transcript_14815/g.27799  ORF Transcript_14815/g.27799 Transcript_14815/m.27799 type:complete len:164 (+) Transcript_14815:73-564(+)
MGSGASVPSVSDVTPAQIKETFGTLSEEEQKKVTEALAKIEAPAEAPAEKKEEAPAAEAPAETPAATPPEEKKEEAPAETKKEEASKLTDEQRSMLKAAFDDIDTNSSGSIEAGELKAVLTKMSVALSEDQIEAVFKRADVNKDGKLSFEEYEKLVCAGMQMQ